MPELSFDFDDENVDQWIGGEIHHVIIREQDLDELMIDSVEDERDENLFDFYVKVFPLVRETDFADGPITQPYVFNIAFYDEE